MMQCVCYLTGVCDHTEYWLASECYSSMRWCFTISQQLRQHAAATATAAEASADAATCTFKQL
jgi:hypothetical protein